jgi:hypothetical protein
VRMIIGSKKQILNAVLSRNYTKQSAHSFLPLL